ncbi:MAG TPA: right-handed parallel beta-helix repeat-containing protein [Planctomycetes bacterium]|nr:right-handed parallel beta-helix repeat-containing protein [Planctomycetota bacterium]
MTLRTPAGTPHRRFAFAPLALFLLGASSAAQRANIVFGGPDRGGEPGSLVAYGRVEGKAPFTFTINGSDVYVSEDTTWQYTITDGPGNVHLELALTDGRGERATASADVLVLPDFLEADDREILYVEDADQLAAALGSHRIVVLRPGDFVLDGLRAGEFAEGIERRGGDGALVLRGLEELDLVGTSGASTRLVNRTPRGTTLVLENTRKVRFVALEIVHDAPEPDADEDETSGREGDGMEPSSDQPSAGPRSKRRGRRVEFRGEPGGALRVNNGYQTWIRYCELSGRGVGLVAQHSNVVILDHSTIRNCTSGILRTINTKHSTFIDSKMLDNGLARPGDIGISIEGRERRDIDFVRMELRGNRPGPGRPLIYMDDGAVPVYFIDGVIQGNQAARLRGGPAAKLFQPSGSEVQKF